jgi:hypothetical protein
VITILGKRGNELDELLLIDKLLGPSDVHFARPEESSAAHLSSSSAPPELADGWTDLSRPLPSIPEEPSPVSSPDHASPNLGSLTESGYKPMDWGATPGPSGPASSTMSSTGHEMMGAHALSNPGMSTETDHEMVDLPPLPGSAPSIESDHEMVDFPPSSSVSSTNPNRQSMGPGFVSGKRKRPDAT